MNNGDDPTIVTDLPPVDSDPKRKRSHKPKPPPRPPTGSAPRPPGRPPKTEKLAERLTENFVMVGVLVASVNTFDGMAIVNGSPQLATSLVAVGVQNPRVMRALERMVETGAWAAVIASVSAIAVPICANHGLIPDAMASALGTAEPLHAAPDPTPA